MTDSLSWMSQLQSIPTKPRSVNAIVAECAIKLAQLTQDNRVDIHFIPSHVAKCGNDDSMATASDTEEVNIGHSAEIDELAKNAAKDGDETEHDPFLSSFKLHLKRKERENLAAYIDERVKTSKFPGYPNRDLFNRPMTRKQLQFPGYPNRDLFNRPMSRKQLQHETPHPLLNRTRTGHSCSRQHLKNINMEESSLCRHCSEHEETVEHQVLHCSALEDKLRKTRKQFRKLQENSFERALWSHPNEMNRILENAVKSGCFI